MKKIFKVNNNVIIADSLEKAIERFEKKLEDSYKDLMLLEEKNGGRGSLYIDTKHNPNWNSDPRMPKIIEEAIKKFNSGDDGIITEDEKRANKKSLEIFDMINEGELDEEDIENDLYVIAKYPIKISEYGDVNPIVIINDLINGKLTVTTEDAYMYQPRIRNIEKQTKLSPKFLTHPDKRERAKYNNLEQYKQDLYWKNGNKEFSEKEKNEWFKTIGNPYTEREKNEWFNYYKAKGSDDYLELLKELYPNAKEENYHKFMKLPVKEQYYRLKKRLNIRQNNELPLGVLERMNPYLSTFFNEEEEREKEVDKKLGYWNNIDELKKENPQLLAQFQGAENKKADRIFGYIKKRPTKLELEKNNIFISEDYFNSNEDKKQEEFINNKYFEGKKKIWNDLEELKKEDPELFSKLQGFGNKYASKIKQYIKNVPTKLELEKNNIDTTLFDSAINDYENFYNMSIDELEEELEKERKKSETAGKYSDRYTHIKELLKKRKTSSGLEKGIFSFNMLQYDLNDLIQDYYGKETSTPEYNMYYNDANKNITFYVRLEEDLKQSNVIRSRIKNWLIELAKKDKWIRNHDYKTDDDANGDIILRISNKERSPRKEESIENSNLKTAVKSVKSTPTNELFYVTCALDKNNNVVTDLPTVSYSNKDLAINAAQSGTFMNRINSYAEKQTEQSEDKTYYRFDLSKKEVVYYAAVLEFKTTLDGLNSILYSNNYKAFKNSEIVYKEEIYRGEK